MSGPITSAEQPPMPPPKQSPKAPIGERQGGGASSSSSSSKNTPVQPASGSSLERGAARLRLAGLFMQPQAANADEAMARITAMKAEDRQALRDRVDWMEEYEREEAIHWPR